MKIELEIPDWVEGKHLYLLAGQELVAYKYLDVPWQIKDGRCNMCGKCCESFPKNRTDNREPKSINGRCVHLQDNEDGTKTCSLGIYRPYKCVIALNNEKECTETWAEHHNQS